ncbi:NAD(P)-dependent alcohol dehydrogenase [Arthrobacter sp. CAN_A1]|uniref:NAD(P)-dependent alcohol dehydrogenase n=1 Tax=Arthrobacter sp. CAN_A1 TaxID=2787717 RepID=UPI0018C989D5
MRAASVTRYGPPERIVISEIPLPEPRQGEALVRVEAAAVTAADARLRAGRFPQGFGLLARLGIGFRGPRARVLGSAFSGRIESVAPGEMRFAPGDEVAGMNGLRMGAHAEYMTVRTQKLVRKPDELSHEDTAGVLFGGATALWFLRDRAGVKSGDRVLINGASGAVGSSAVQLARYLGATVTAVTSSRNRDLAVRLGAGRVLDYEEVPVATIDDHFDVVFDAVGNLSRSEGLRLLVPTGSLLLAVASLFDTVRARGRVHAGPAPERGDDFAFLLDLVVRGDLDTVTEVVGGLERVREAHRRIDTGRKVGNLVILPQVKEDAAQ